MPDGHRIKVRKGAYGFFYVSCRCGWRRTDGFAAEGSADHIGELHLREPDQPRPGLDAVEVFPPKQEETD